MEGGKGGKEDGRKRRVIAAVPVLVRVLVLVFVLGLGLVLVPVSYTHLTLPTIYSV